MHLADWGLIRHESRLNVSLPGIPCGMMFYGRAEMYVVGLHKHWLAGICYITGKVITIFFQMIKPCVEFKSVWFIPGWMSVALNYTFLIA